MSLEKEALKTRDRKILLQFLEQVCVITDDTLLKLATRAVILECPKCLYEIGKIYIDKDNPEPHLAAHYFKNAIQYGDIGAMHDYACLIVNNRELGIDLKEAFIHLEKAAKCGSSLSYNNLGVIYEKGEIVPKNIERAIQMYICGIRLGCNVSFNTLLKYFKKTRSSPTSILLQHDVNHIYQKKYLVSEINNSYYVDQIDHISKFIGSYQYNDYTHYANACFNVSGTIKIEQMQLVVDRVCIKHDLCISLHTEMVDMYSEIDELVVGAGHNIYAPANSNKRQKI